MINIFNVGDFFPSLRLIADHRQSGYKVSVHSTWAKTDILTPLQYWSHYCVIYDNNDNSWKIYQNGEKKAEGRMKSYFGVLEGNGAYIIGGLYHGCTDVYICVCTNLL